MLKHIQGEVSRDELRKGDGDKARDEELRATGR